MEESFIRTRDRFYMCKDVSRCVYWSSVLWFWAMQGFLLSDYLPMLCTPFSFSLYYQIQKMGLLNCSEPSLLYIQFYMEVNHGKKALLFLLGPFWLGLWTHLFITPKINLGQAYMLQANNHKRELCKMKGRWNGKGSFIHLFLNVFSCLYFLIQPLCTLVNHISQVLLMIL